MMQFFLAVRVASLAVWMCAALGTAAVAQAPALTSVWQRIHYPPVPIPGTASEAWTFTVASGGHSKRPDEEPSHLRLNINWSARDGVPLPTPIADAGAVVVRLHTADGKVVTVPRGMGWMGTGGGGYAQWHLINILPWSRNALDEAWFEVRVPGQTWWVELPYGFARDPEDPEIPDRTRAEPRFLPTMLPLGARDILVPWLSVEYDVGRIHDGGLLSVKVGNPFTPTAAVTLFREYSGELGPDRNRQNLDSPRIAASIETPGDTAVGHELARRLSEDRHYRTDDFTFGCCSEQRAGRAFGTVAITIDGRRYGVRVPSSLFLYVHGRTDYEHKQWMRVPR